MLRDLPNGARIFVTVVVLLGFLMFGFLFWGLFTKIFHKEPLPFNYLILLGFCIFAPVVIIAELRPEEFLGKISTTISFSVIYAAILFIGKEAAVLIAILRSITSGFINKVRWLSLLFNISHCILSVSIAGFIFGCIDSGRPLFGIPDARLSFLLVAALFSGFNIASVYSYIKLLEIHARDTLTYQLQWRDIKVETAIFAAFFLVKLYKNSPLIIVLMFLPSLVICYVIKNYRKLQTETMKTLEALASGIEQRYGYGSQHTSAVVEYAVKLAKKKKLHRLQVETIESAAKIHDLGKVSIPDEILMKPGPLNEDEFMKMKEHAAIGGEIASKLSAYKLGVDIIRHHHERYDGSGYPDRLKGDEIPVGARILAIADCYDAMTNERPYRKARDTESVIEEFTRCKGTHFDPDLVDLFLEIIREEEQEKERKNRGKKVEPMGRLVEQAEKGGKPGEKHAEQVEKRMESGGKQAEPGEKRREPGERRAEPDGKHREPVEKRTESGGKAVEPGRKRIEWEGKKTKPEEKRGH